LCALENIYVEHLFAKLNIVSKPPCIMQGGSFCCYASEKQCEDSVLCVPFSQSNQYISAHICATIQIGGIRVKLFRKNIFVSRDTESTTKHATLINSTLKTEYMRAEVEKLRKTQQRLCSA